MKSSFYNFIFSHANSVYLYNTLSTSIIQIDDLIKESLDTGDFSNLANETLDALFENGIIVNRQLDESKAFLYYYDKTRLHRSSEKLHIIFVPTYSCNLACSYCIQDIEKKPKVISEIDINKLIRFITNIIDNENIKDLMLSFYGGEPLLAKKQCIYFAEKVKEICNNKSVNLQTYITTNATLVDQEIIDKLLIPFDTYMQISIDGLKSTHDSKRHFHNNSGTFDLINSALELLNFNGLKDKITLRINIDLENVNQSDEILELFKDKSNDIYFGLLKPVGHNINSSICISDDDCSSVYDFELSNKLLKYGVKTVGQKFGKKMPCSLNSENKFYVDNLLNLYKCDLMLGKQDFSVGNISNEGEFIPNHQFYQQLTRTPSSVLKCQKCKLLPLCAGGCAAKALFLHNDLHAPFCEVSFDQLKNYLINYIKLQII